MRNQDYAIFFKLGEWSLRCKASPGDVPSVIRQYIRSLPVALQAKALNAWKAKQQARLK